MFEIKLFVCMFGIRNVLFILSGKHILHFLSKNISNMAVHRLTVVIFSLTGWFILMADSNFQFYR